jgi:membrane-bound ClpP family serine protease
MKWPPSIRRSLAIALIVLGATLMFLAPETWAGLALLVTGVALELAGIALRKGDAG